MEISQNVVDVINDLIKINNDRVAGFEKAGTNLEGGDNVLISVFTKLAGESRQYVSDLTDIALQSAGEAAEGTSTSGDLHRAWIELKTAFTGNDALAILNECETGEDAAVSAYRDALDRDDELPAELTQVLQMQQQGITEGHDLIRSLRDQYEAAAETNNDDLEGAETKEPSSQEQQQQSTAESSYEGSASEFDRQNNNVPEPETVEQEEDWRDNSAATANSKLMEFFVDELKDLLWAEQELVDTLPDMAEAATCQELKDAFYNHLAETQTHVTRLEQIFGILGIEPDTTKCDAMAGIVDEGDEIISNTEEGTAQRDVGLIFAGQKAEHYEIASYGGMISLAKTLGYYEIAELLVLTIDEEKSADALLSEIAENNVNYAASTEQAED